MGEYITHISQTWRKWLGKLGKRRMALFAVKIGGGSVLFLFPFPFLFLFLFLVFLLVFFPLSGVIIYLKRYILIKNHNNIILYYI